MLQNLNIHQEITSKKAKIVGSSNNSQILAPKNHPKIILKVIHHSPQKKAQKPQHCLECTHLKNEHTLLSNLSHPTIIKPLVPLETHKNYCAITLPRAQTDLYEHLQKINILPIHQAKNLFYSILSALNYLHTEKKIVHNDIKLENFLVFYSEKEKKSAQNDNFSLKIADFGFSLTTDYIEEQGIQAQYNRWDQRDVINVAPEIIQILKQQKNEKLLDETKNDMFALGIALFESVFPLSPFQRGYASEVDPLFKFIYQKNYKKFWKNKEIQNTINSYMLNCGNDQEFSGVKQDFYHLQDLLNNLLCVDPQARFSAEQALQHPWFQSIQ